MQSLNSSFYIGKVCHRREAPKIHAFTYPLYMALVDLDEVDILAQRFWWFSNRRWAPLQFRALDYLRDFRGQQQRCMQDSHTLEQESPSQLRQRVIQAVAHLGGDINGLDQVRMLCHLRSFGLYFSPINFFFVFGKESNENIEGKAATSAQSKTKPRYLLAEVSNTPWNERHLYLVDLQHGRVHQETPKAFHVSPFMDLNMKYHWWVKAPVSQGEGTSTYIQIENVWIDNASLDSLAQTSVQSKRLFRASFVAKRVAMTNRSACKVFGQWPVITFTVVKGIYWQALKLFAKGIAYVPKS